MNGVAKPKVLIVYHTLTKQSGRVVDAMAKALEARGCEVTKAMIEFTDKRWVPKLSQFPMKRPILQIASILLAQLGHKTGAIRIPSEAQAGEYDLVLIASPTWWFQTSMPIRSYLESTASNTSSSSAATTTTSSSGPCRASVTSASTRARRSSSQSLSPTNTSSTT